MSWHVLHLLTPDVQLRKYRGFLRCIENEESIPRQIPFEDLKAIVIATRGVTLTSEVLSACMEHKVIVMHCDSKFAVCGLTVPVIDATNPEVLRRQVREESLNAALWRRVLRAKINNQACVLEHIGADATYLRTKLHEDDLNESAAAKYYFGKFFSALGAPELTRRHNDGHAINCMLNYGYAVIQGMIHRSLVGHGLNPVHGIHHTDRYQAHALVYDIMEPWRPFLDLMVYAYARNVVRDDEPEFKHFKSYIAFSQHSWQKLTFDISNNKIKMINSIDYQSASLSNAYVCQNADLLWLPTLEASHATDLLKWDGHL